MTSAGTAPATNPRPLSEVARHVVAPEGIASTGWPSVEATCRRLGWRFDRWQADAGRLILAKRSGGDYAADTTVISIPRQVGKTYLVACIIFALCLLFPGLTVIWTAHRKTTARETFDQFDGMAQRPKVAPHVRQVLRGKGDESIQFNNGSRILFGARESGFGRGFAGVDILVCDEGQILPESTLEDLGATQNTAPNPLFFVMGTPPRPRDDGEFFTALRVEALEGESDSTLYIETSADRGTPPMDADQLRKANPSYPYRTSHRALLRLRKKLKNDDAWNREARGIWDEIKTLKTPFTNWPNCTTGVVPAPDVAPDVLGVDMSHDRVIAVVGCWVDPEVPEDSHLELLTVDSTGDTAAAVDWLVAQAGRRIRVLIDSLSPAASMAPALRARKVDVMLTSAGDMGKACGGLFDAVRDGHAWHLEATEDNRQKALDDAMAGCLRRDIGKAGAWGLDRSNPDQNIAPAVAAALAHFGGSMTKRKRSKTRGVIYS